MAASRREKCRANHSMRSAYTFGGKCSTVVGRLTIIGIGRRRAPRAGDRLADLEREVELGVMEALGRVLEADAVAGEAAAHLRAAHGQLGDARLARAGRRRGAASPTSSCRDGRSRCVRPAIDSNVRSISSGRACVSTAIVTSSGMRSSSISVRTKSKSAFDAAGKPTSISLNPSSSSSAKNRRLRCGVHGVDERLVAVAQVGRAPDRARR